MSEITLKFPTVGDLVDALAKYPRTHKLTIEDADTNNSITTIHINDDLNDEVYMYGTYAEMREDRKVSR